MKQTVTSTAKKIGISQGAFSNILACRRNPHWLTAVAIAKVLGTEPQFWMKGESTSEERWEAFHSATTIFVTTADAGGQCEREGVA